MEKRVARWRSKGDFATMDRKQRAAPVKRDSKKEHPHDCGGGGLRVARHFQAACGLKS